MGEEACSKTRPFHSERHRLDEVRKRGDTGLMTPFPLLVLSLPKDQPDFITWTSVEQLYILKCSLHGKMTSRNDLSRTQVVDWKFLLDLSLKKIYLVWGQSAIWKRLLWKGNEVARPRLHLKSDRIYRNGKMSFFIPRNYTYQKLFYFSFLF